MDKKIGILTFHRAINYGAILQAYALCRFINSIFEENSAVIVDYRCEKIQEAYKLLSAHRGIFQLLKDILALFKNLRKKIKFKNFINKNMKVSSSFYDKNTVKILENEFDLFITGSDQVWNYSLTDHDNTYLLDFVSDYKKKNSYAASFGFINVYEENKDEYLRLLQSFNNISLREDIGVNDIRMSGKQPIRLLDPVFLLNKSEWMELSQLPKVKSKHILLFTVLAPLHLQSFAQDLSKKTGLPIVFLTDSLRNFKDIKKIGGRSPEEFLGLFANAEYILTTSFHGTAFSIIFEKYFFVEIDNGKLQNTRVENLLTLLNLEDRIISHKNAGNLDKTIDWVSVANILNTEKERALKYLGGVLNG